MSTSKEIIYVSGSYIPAAGGSEQTMHTLMIQLANRDYPVSAITRQVIGQPNNEQIEGVPVCRIAAVDLNTVLSERLRSPAIVLTQLMWSDKVIRICQQMNTPVIYFVRSSGGNLDISIGGEYQVTEIIANSEVTRKFVTERWKRDSTVVHPLVDYQKYLFAHQTDSCISMVNPVEPKGGEIFKSVAQKLPNKKFLAAKGWDFLKTPLGDWDLIKMQEMADAHQDKLHLPTDVSLSDIANIELVGPFEDMRNFYCRTRLLLMPSLWDEAFGRVVVEAMINGIPVIASNKGYLKDTVGGGGIIIDNPYDIESWISAIRSLDNLKHYAYLQEQAKLSARRFNLENELNKVVKVLNRLA